MELPNKIYVNNEQAQRNDVCRYWEFATDKRIKDNDVEFTNLSSVWHDARVDREPQGVCGNNPVLIVGLRNGRISYRYLWEDWEDCWQDLELLAASPTKTYEKVLWAYLRDIVPGVKKKGF